MSDFERPGPYESALDLPSIATLLEQIKGAKMLTRIIGRKHRQDIIEIERQIRDLASVVDRFYALLGERQWVFHDMLNVERVREIFQSGEPPEQAEQRFIEIYRDSETLEFMIRTLRRFSEMQVRMHLIERAREDYQAGRFYATTLSLLSVMDGFVNDVDKEARRGLHSRTDDEMAAWDSVVGHHKGLSFAHKTFTKTIKKTVTEEIFELQRHGIVHGMIVNYDNVIVATKAWNRLFAVADWATSRQKQAAPKPKDPSFRETLAQIVKTQRARESLDAWNPSVMAKGEGGFEEQEAFKAAEAYLSSWKAKNFGRMARFLPLQMSESTPNKTAGRIREEFERLELRDFEILRLDFSAAAVCEVDVILHFDDEAKPGRMRWIRETAAGEPATPNEDGRWRLWLWGPYSIMNRAAESRSEDEDEA